MSAYLIVAALIGATPSAPANMVTNPGFEDGANGWGVPAALYTIDDAVAHSGNRSLRYRNVANGPYMLTAQGLPLKPGKAYRFSVWVKTEGVGGPSRGAAICVEWGGKDGYISGCYSPGLQGDNDWTQIVFETKALPPEVTGGSVIVYGTGGTYGTAWFDDVEVVEMDEPLCRVGFVGEPAGETHANYFSGLQPSTVHFQAELLSDREGTPDDLTMQAAIEERGPRQEFTGGTWHGRVCTLDVPGDKLPWGQTMFDVRLVSKKSGRPVTSAFLWASCQRLAHLDIVEPNPAGAVGIAPGESQDFAVRLSVRKAHADRTTRYQVKLTLSQDGKPVGQALRGTLSDAKPTVFRFPSASLATGLYDLKCELSAEGSTETLAAAQALLSKANAADRPANATWFGPNRMLMVGGKPFFPMGFYILSSFETVFPADRGYNWMTGKLYPSYYLPLLDRLGKSHFNCFIDYGGTLGGMDAAREVLDAAQARGLHEIFSVKDLMKGAFWEAYTKNLPWKDLQEATRQVVGDFRKHPALLAWYINDETTSPDVWQGVVDDFRNTRATDPWHPTYAVHCDYPALDRYAEACDAIGTDPYVLCGDISDAAHNWHTSRDLIGREKPFWAVVQCMGIGYEMSNPADTREPTYAEERAATMAAIAEGSTGIIYYCYHSLQRSPRFEERFAELDKIAAEVQGLVPVIALPNAAEPVVVEAGKLSAITKQGKGKLHVILASTERSDQDVVLRLPGRPKSVRDVTAGKALEVVGGRVKMHFPALDARVLEIVMQ